jgi:hypothetical protein
MARTIETVNKELDSLATRISTHTSALTTAQNALKTAGTVEARKKWRATIKKTKETLVKLRGEKTAATTERKHLIAFRDEGSKGSDPKRKALPPGRRTSKTGRKYTENRPGHADLRPGRKV